jgi:acyl-CoA synthetase (AMP-forming)/AMP-acid ligase II
MPRSISIADSLPLTPVGKVLRRTVRDACREKMVRN